MRKSIFHPSRNNLKSSRKNSYHLLAKIAKPTSNNQTKSQPIVKNINPPPPPPPPPKKNFQPSLKFYQSAEYFSTPLNISQPP